MVGHEKVGLVVMVILKELTLFGLVLTQSLLLLGMAYQVRKANVCNAVLVCYLSSVRGVKVNLDLIYRDGKKWISNPRYSAGH